MSNDNNDRSRRAGVLLPLFSVRTQHGWGMGEIPDPPNRARELYWGTFIGVRYAEAFTTLARGREL